VTNYRSTSTLSRAEPAKLTLLVLSEGPEVKHVYFGYSLTETKRPAKDSVPMSLSLLWTLPPIRSRELAVATTLSPELANFEAELLCPRGKTPITKFCESTKDILWAIVQQFPELTEIARAVTVSNEGTQTKCLMTVQQLERLKQFLGLPDQPFDPNEPFYKALEEWKSKVQHSSDLARVVHALLKLPQAAKSGVKVSQLAYVVLSCKHKFAGVEPLRKKLKERGTVGLKDILFCSDESCKWPLSLLDISRILGEEMEKYKKNIMRPSVNPIISQV
jgi:hypothetical protein